MSEPVPFQWQDPAQAAEDWQRVHPLSPIVRAGAAIVPLGFVFAGSFSNSLAENATNAIVHLLAVVAFLVAGVVYWSVTRWRIEAGTLRIETGLLRRSSVRLPLDQIQAIDTVRPGLARIFGLSELRLRMAGVTTDDGRLAYLKQGEAERVRARLLALAHGVAEHAPPPPEDKLFTVRTDLLIWTTFLSSYGGIILAFVIAIIITAAFSLTLALTVLGSAFVPLLGIGIAGWRRFNALYQLTVAVAPDGLRVRSGLVATSAETIPRGRIQGVRVDEPMLWRPFGWGHLVIDVAGTQQRIRRDPGSSNDTGQRVLIPVGTKHDIETMLHTVIPDFPTGDIKPPKRARWKNIIQYQNLSWGRNARMVVTTYGRLRRVTDYVPLNKIQSLRYVQGPVQRVLRLASVHLDSAGSDISAVLLDRDAATVREELEELVQLSRNARAMRAISDS